MLSVVIFHGPSAYDQALEKSLTPGFRPIHSPMGGGGLKKEEAQRVVELVSQPPIGDSIGTLVVGPMDLATVASQDSLLKSIEDGRDQHVILILWANDLGEVKSTIRSRCVSIWCPGTPRLDDELLQLAEGVLVALSKKNLFEITLLLEKIKPPIVIQQDLLLSCQVSLFSHFFLLPPRCHLVLCVRRCTTAQDAHIVAHDDQVPNRQA